MGRLRTGPWTDVHALALRLVELLVGERAYRGANTVELFSRITAHERPTPRAFGVDVGPWEPTLERALALDPRARHPDADALLRDLDAGLDAAQGRWGLPIAAAPAGPTPTRRRALAAALAALAACAALAAWRLTPPRADARPMPPRLAAAAAPSPITAAPVVLAPRPTPAPVAAVPASPPARRAVSRVAPRPTLARGAARPPTHPRELAIE